MTTKAWARLLGAAMIGLALAVTGCGERAAGDLTIERLEDVTPSLPEVPTLPPPPYPTTLPDESYTAYGLRRRAATTMDSDVAVTAYIVEMYLPPECPTGRTCDPPSAPHLWLSDQRTPTDEDERILLAGYAENQQQIDEAVELAGRGRYEPPDPESGILPVPVDFGIGAKIKVRARFTRVSGAGFNVSNGMLEYRGHELVEPAPEAEED